MFFVLVVQLVNIINLYHYIHICMQDNEKVIHFNIFQGKVACSGTYEELQSSPFLFDIIKVLKESLADTEQLDNDTKERNRNSN